MTEECEGSDNFAPLAYSNEPLLSAEEQERRKTKRENREKMFVKKNKKSNRRKNTDWCHCNNCIPMDTEIESVCCMEYANSDGVFENKLGNTFCITLEDDFNATVINQSVLKTAWIQYDLMRCRSQVDAVLSKLVTFYYND